MIKDLPASSLVSVALLGAKLHARQAMPAFSRHRSVRSPCRFLAVCFGRPGIVERRAKEKFRVFLQIFLTSEHDRMGPVHFSDEAVDISRMRAERVRPVVATPLSR